MSTVAEKTTKKAASEKVENNEAVKKDNYGHAGNYLTDALRCLNKAQELDPTLNYSDIIVSLTADRDARKKVVGKPKSKEQLIAEMEKIKKRLATMA